jgi:hypothetical protein
VTFFGESLAKRSCMCIWGGMEAGIATVGSILTLTMDIDMTGRETVHGALEAWLEYPDLPVISMKVAVASCDVTETIAQRVMQSNRIPIVMFEGESFIPQKSLRLIMENYNSQVSNVTGILEDVARKGDTITYTMLADAVGLSYNTVGDRRTLIKIIDSVCKQSSSESSFLLAAIARRNHSSTSMPPENFFIVADRLGYRIDNEKRFVEGQTERIWSFYSLGPVIA